MAKKTNKTSHVLNLITGSQPPVASSGETQPSSSASGETQQEGSAAEEPVRVPSANVTALQIIMSEKRSFGKTRPFMTSFSEIGT